MTDLASEADAEPEEMGPSELSEERASRGEGDPLHAEVDIEIWLALSELVRHANSSLSLGECGKKFCCRRLSGLPLCFMRRAPPGNPNL
jgi:hypothetical protein